MRKKISIFRSSNNRMSLKNKDIILMIDEVELGLHPGLQKILSERDYSAQGHALSAFCGHLHGGFCGKRRR